jgi:ribosomal protein L11 methyltransferase
MDTVPVNDKFDIILANINLNVILDNLASIKEASAEGGTILFSGILKENELTLLNAIREVGLGYLATNQRGDWIVITAKLF